MLLIVFIVVWLALPLVLIPLVFYYRSKYRKLESENSQLKAASGSPTQETISSKPVQSGNPYTPPPLRVIPVRDKPYSVTSIDSPQIPVNASLTYASKQSDAQAELFAPTAQPTPEAQAELFTPTAQPTPEAQAELFSQTAQPTPASASEYRTIAPPASANPAPRVEKDSGGGVAMIFGVIFVALAGLAFASTTCAATVLGITFYLRIRIR